MHHPFSYYSVQFEQGMEQHILKNALEILLFPTGRLSIRQSVSLPTEEPHSLAKLRDGQTDSD